MIQTYKTDKSGICLLELFKLARLSRTHVQYLGTFAKAVIALRGYKGFLISTRMVAEMKVHAPSQ